MMLKWNDEMDNSSGTSSFKVDIYCPVEVPKVPETLQTATDHQLPPLIIHVNVSSCPSTLNIIKILCATTPLKSERYIKELCEFGAIYLRIGEILCNKSNKPQRIKSSDLHDNILLPEGERVYIRVYAIPKRHFAITPLKIIEKSKDVLIVCKPCGLPVTPSVDNVQECVLSTVEKEYNNNERLYITTRLDIGTSGILILAKSKQIVPKINKALSAGCKTYIACTEIKPRLGKLKHWLNAAVQRHSGILKQRLVMEYHNQMKPIDQECNKWVEASLEIIKIEKHGKYWKSWINLETGRTHQIRIQFAAEGWPLIGDTKYNKIGKSLKKDPVENKIELGNDSPCIGLHALSLEIDIEESGETRKLEANLELRETFPR